MQVKLLDPNHSYKHTVIISRGFDAVVHDGVVYVHLNTDKYIEVDAVFLDCMEQEIPGA